MKFFLKSHLNIVWGNLRPLPLILSLVTLKKRWTPTLLKPAFISDLRMFLPCPLSFVFIPLWCGYTPALAYPKKGEAESGIVFLIHEVFLP